MDALERAEHTLGTTAIYYCIAFCDSSLVDGRKEVKNIIVFDLLTAEEFVLKKDIA
jgi:hypothetical protein